MRPDAALRRHERRVGEDDVGVLVPAVLAGERVVFEDVRIAEAVQIHIHQRQAHHVGRDVVALEVPREAAAVVGGQRLGWIGLVGPIGRVVRAQDVLPGRDQEPRGAAGRVEHGLVLFRIDDGDDEVDDVPGCAELPGVALGPEHGQQVLEGVAEALGVVVSELVDDLQEHLERFGVAVGQVGVLEDVAEQQRDTGILRHLGDALGV